MLEKLLYKIVDFGRRHPRLKVFVLLPLAIVYLLDSILYYLGLPFRLIAHALYDHSHKDKTDDALEDTLEKPIVYNKRKRIRNAFIVFILLALCLTYPAMRYVRSLSQPMLITAFDEIENDVLMIEQGTSIEKLMLPEEINAVGYILDKNGEPTGNEKHITIKITSWNAEPGYDEDAALGSAYMFTPILDEQFQTAAAYPSVQRIVGFDEAVEDEQVIEIYLNGQGNDLNDGSSVMQAVKSLDRAIELLGDREGFIWIMNGITIKDEQIWDAKQLITLKRFTGTSSIPPYTGALIDIRTNGSLTLNNIIIDGSEEIESSAPAIIVDGYLELSGNTQIINNQYADHAGAVDVGKTGTMMMSADTNLNNCSTDVTGSSISSVKGSVLIEISE